MQNDWVHVEDKTDTSVSEIYLNKVKATSHTTNRPNQLTQLDCATQTKETYKNDHVADVILAAHAQSVDGVQPEADCDSTSELACCCTVC